MGHLYDENGEKLAWVGTKEARLRGRFDTDDTGEWRIDGQSLSEILADADYDTFDADDLADDEVVLNIKIDAHAPTGEFRDD